MKKLIPLPLRQYAKFDGRITRSRFWRWFLFIVIVYTACLYIDLAYIGPAMGVLPFEEGGIKYLTWAVSLSLAIPYIASAVRRMHDIDKSGWWLLIALTIVGIPVIFVMQLLKGSPEPNRFGERD